MKEKSEADAVAEEAMIAEDEKVEEEATTGLSQALAEEEADEIVEEKTVEEKLRKKVAKPKRRKLHHQLSPLLIRSKIFTLRPSMSVLRSRRWKIQSNCKHGSAEATWRGTKAL